MERQDGQNRKREGEDLTKEAEKHPRHKPVKKIVIEVLEILFGNVFLSRREISKMIRKYGVTYGQIAEMRNSEHDIFNCNKDGEGAFHGEDVLKLLAADLTVQQIIEIGISAKGIYQNFRDQIIEEINGNNGTRGDALIEKINEIINANDDQMIVEQEVLDVAPASARTHDDTPAYARTYDVSPAPAQERDVSPAPISPVGSCCTAA